MSRTITIHFPPEQAESRDLIHRVRNYGETVFSYVRESGLGDLDMGEVDAAIMCFAVREVKASKSRRLLRWIEEEAVRQHLRIRTEVG